MDAIAVLKEMHEEAKQTFQRIDGASPQERGSLWRRLEPELKVHEQMEEQHLYGPVAREVGDREASLQEWASHHHEEVQELEELITSINGLDPSAPGWLEEVRELRTTLEHHIQEEEGDIWPKIQQAWDRQKLEQAGQAMQAMKERAKRAA
jgi:iron-sulfur cluster repair protein YtfE (RIC family)